MQTNIATLVLTDAASTPVNHTFTPTFRTAENTARWFDREHNGGIPIGMPSVSFSVREPNSVGGVYRVKASLAYPHLDLTVPTAPVLLGTSRVNCEFIFPDNIGDDVRKNIIAMMRDLLTVGTSDNLGDNIVVLTLPY